MPRPKSLNPAVPLTTHIDAGLKAKLDTILYSELEERVPHGAYQKFFNVMLTQALSSVKLDLSPFIGTNPGEAIVRGDPASIARLKAHLEQK